MNSEKKTDETVPLPGGQVTPVPGSRFTAARDEYRRKVLRTSALKDSLFLLTGIASAGFGLKGFLLPSNFIDGGATGISLLINEVTNIPIAILLVAVNIPFVLLGYKQFNSQFTLKTIFAITGLAIAVAFVDYPVITSDKLLVAVFGGFFLGAGIGLAVRGGGVLDGSEVVALAISRKSGLTMGDVILIFNILIFSVAAWLLSIETALYAILTYLAAAKTVDFIIEGIEEYTGVTIISPKNEEISRILTKSLGRGFTVYKGMRGFGKRGFQSEGEINIIYTVVTRLEVSRLQAEIEAIDPNAFVIMQSVKDAKGGMIKKRPLHGD
ncbi:MAG: YitT family protein [Gemmatimonadaceae bacterium]|nr:YitT family protein [Chitinophagaceae bacterium]